MVESNIWFGLASAVLWGGGDFAGGMGAKTVGGTVAGALRIVLLSHLTSFAGLLAITLLGGYAMPHGRVLGWGVAAGVAGGLSITAFYVALARGGMGVSAAVSGLLAAAIPAAVSMASEGWPGGVRLAGFVVAGAAIWLIAGGAEEAGSAGTMALAIGAGAGFGLYFVALKMAGAAGPVGAMVSARMGSLGACSLLWLGLALTGKAGRVAGVRGALRWVLLTALLDSGGNMMFVAATRAGRLDVAAVLASLYPASTILLAGWMLHERPTRRQGTGMVAAAAAVVMITL